MNHQSATTRKSQTRPSGIYLPKREFPTPTIFEHLLARFPQVQPLVWRARVSGGLLTLRDGSPLREDSPYRHGIFVFYRKEVPSEPEPREEALVIYRDKNILIVDKPHGMPVTPAGQHLERSLLVRLERSTGLSTLAAMHRLDRETAGLLLLTSNTAVRAAYHRLFSERTIEREYMAVAHIVNATTQRHWRGGNRKETGEAGVCQQNVGGPAGALTPIELLEVPQRRAPFL